MSDSYFNFDLERMIECVECKSYTVPKNMSFERYKIWLKSFDTAKKMKDYTSMSPYHDCNFKQIYTGAELHFDTDLEGNSASYYGYIVRASTDKWEVIGVPFLKSDNITQELLIRIGCKIAETSDSKMMDRRASFDLSIQDTYFDAIHKIEVEEEIDLKTNVMRNLIKFADDHKCAMLTGSKDKQDEIIFIANRDKPDIETVQITVTFFKNTK